MLPPAARSHHQRIQLLQAVTLLALRRSWRQMRATGPWSEQYREDVGPKLVALVVAAQMSATRESDAYMAEVLAELDLVPGARPGVIRASAFAGYAGDGREVAGLLEQSVVHAGMRFNRARRDGSSRVFDAAAAAQEALDDTELWLEMVAQTILADTVRSAESAAMSSYGDVDGYVRMLNPPSCSRCAILAGRFYRWNAGFPRHPRCDCIHIPAREADFGDLRVNPGRYFDSLSAAEQDRIFTTAGAQAIRDGADIGQVVNARRGMRTAAQNQRGWIPRGRLTRTDAFGRSVFVTTEGVTKRGRGRAAMGAGRPVRLMPESIYELAAGDRAEAVRLLKLYGYLT